jgi:hypothetical protein
MTTERILLWGSEGLDAEDIMEAGLKVEDNMEAGPGDRG